MRSRSAEEVRALVLAECAAELAALGVRADAITDDFDLRMQGVIDSLGFLELVTALEDELGVELDLEALDPSELTQLGALTRHVAAQTSGHAPADPTSNGLAPIAP